MGDNPNYAEDAKGEYGHGNPDQLLSDLLESAGIDRDEVYYTPAVKCRKAENGKVSATQMKACKEYLLEELSTIKPGIVITLGATALKSLTNKAKITDLHGKTHEHKMGFKLLPTFHPAMSLRDPRYWDRIHTDFRRFGKLANGEELRVHTLNARSIRSRGGLEDVLSAVRRSGLVAYDLETNGLQPRLKTSEIGQTVIATRTQEFVVEHSSFSYATLRRWHEKMAIALEGKEVLAQNGKFDNLWLHYMFGVRFPLTFDIMLASHLLDENSPNDLKQNARTELEMEDWDIPLHIKNGKGLDGNGLTPDEERQRTEYAAWDGYATVRLWRVYKDRLAQDDALNRVFYELVMPIARTYEVIEINGIHIDQERMAEAQQILQTKIRKLKRILDRHINPWRRAANDKVYDGDNNVIDINWNSGAFVNRVLFDWLGLEPMGLTDGGAPSTAEDNLLKMKGQHEIIEVLLEYRGAFKQVSSFIDGWNKRMIDGYIYPGYKVHGTVTGRPACANPNLQQVPRDPFIRSLIGAPPGWAFFEIDQSQVELRLAAVAANEPTMLAIFRGGGDIHESTYQRTFGISTEEAVAHIEDPGKRKAQLKEERKKAKAINFGFIYGMGWKLFMEYAASKFGLVVSEAEAKKIRKRFFEIYSGLVKWHERQRRLVHVMKGVRTLTGRIRHLPQVDSPDRGLMSEAERNAINAPIQGFGAEIVLMATIEVNKFFNNHLVKIQGTIHDAMVGLIREDVVLECAARIKAIMESPKIMADFGIELPLPLVADVTIGNWGNGKEYDAADLPAPIELDENYEPLAA
ncbi:DNA polymerase [Pseudomonas phage Almagne]|nr:DNA polymerase [Pseudomonas phage Almagne]